MLCDLTQQFSTPTKGVFKKTKAREPHKRDSTARSIAPLMSQKAVKHLRSHLSRQSQLLVIAGLLILAVIILLMKQEPKVEPVAATELPEEQLQRAAQGGTAHAGVLPFAQLHPLQGDDGHRRGGN